MHTFIFFFFPLCKEKAEHDTVKFVSVEARS